MSQDDGEISWYHGFGATKICIKSSLNYVGGRCFGHPYLKQPIVLGLIYANLVKELAVI